MFRENVVIALSILVILLIVSYVMIMVTYMQIADLEDRLAAVGQLRLRRLHKEQIQPFFETAIESDKDPNHLVTDNEFKISQDDEIEDEDIGSIFQIPMRLLHQHPVVANEEARTKKDVEDFLKSPPAGSMFDIPNYIENDPVSTEDSIKISYNYVVEGRHVILKIPELPKRENVKQEDVISIIVEEAKEFFRRLKVRDIKKNIATFNGIGGISFHYFFGENQEGHFWVRNDALKHLLEQRNKTELSEAGRISSSNESYLMKKRK